jgi:hypothetical protein
MTAIPPRPPAAAPACTATLVQELAGEALELTAWILTPEDGYEPVGEPVGELLRAAACRLQYPYVASGPALCAQVTEVAACAVAFAFAVRRNPTEAAPRPAAEPVNPLARLSTLPREALPELMRAAARACRDARVI